MASGRARACRARSRALDLPGSKNASDGRVRVVSVFLDGELVCSCLVLAGQAEGRGVVTVEGLTGDGELHEVQRAFVEAGAVQSGFCTPGLVVAGHDLLARTPRRATTRSARRWPATCAAARAREDPRRVRLAADDSITGRSRPRAGRPPRRSRFDGHVIDGWRSRRSTAPDEFRDGRLVINGDRLLAVGAGATSTLRRTRAGSTDRHVRHPRPRQLPPPPYRWGRAAWPSRRRSSMARQLYPVSAHVDGDVEWAAARAGLAALARSGVDHRRPPLRVPAAAGNLLEVEVSAAGRSTYGPPCHGR